MKLIRKNYLISEWDLNYLCSILEKQNKENYEMINSKWSWLFMLQSRKAKKITMRWSLVTEWDFTYLWRHLTSRDSRFMITLRIL